MMSRIPSSRWSSGLGLGAAFVGLAFIAFGSALRAPFDFDDITAITQNSSIRQLWPPSVALNPPPLGTAVSGRPVVNVSFALNYAVNRLLGIAQSPTANAPLAAVGYHVVNILLHAIAALLLLAIIRRTLRTGRVPEEWRDLSDRIAIIVAGIWLIHPIQTDAVDYISQRTELLASVCYLGTLYASIRAWNAGGVADANSSSASRRRAVWSAVAVALSLLGMGSKEIMITAPIIVMLYDRAFLASSWSMLWQSRPRRRLYGALFATTAVTLTLVATGARGGTAGFGGEMPWYEYFYSQAWAIPHYVRLLLWPDRLTFDYGSSPVHGIAGLLGLVALIAAGAATLVAWRRSQTQWLGFLGAWFFLLLAPSSSFVPIRTEIAAERRVYLASAAVILLLVVAVERLSRRLPRKAPHRAVRIAVIAAVASALLVATSRRSAMYDDLRVRWLDGIAKTPTNGRAYTSLAYAELKIDPPQIATADSLLRRSMILDSMFIPAWVLDAKIASSQNRFADAALLMEHALRLHPEDAAATEELGKVFLSQKRPELALPYLRQVAALRPDAESTTMLGLALLMTRQLDSAIVDLKQAARLDSTRVDAQRYLGAALVENERGSEALPYIQRAVRLDSTSGILLGLLSLAYAQSGHPDLAARTAVVALTRAPDDATVYVFAGRALYTVGQYPESAGYLEQAVLINPNEPQALTRLGMAELAMGHKAKARHLFEKVLARFPDYTLAQQGIRPFKRERQ